MKRTTKTKLKAWFFLLGTMFLTLMIAEIIFLLLIWHPFLKDGSGLKGIGVVILIAWLYGSMYLWNRAVKRRTRWLEIKTANNLRERKEERNNPCPSS